MSMKLRVVPARRGLGWVKEGLRLTLRQPSGFLGLMGPVVILFVLAMTVPVLGPLMAMAAPGIWMAFMLASRRALAGERITPSLLIEPYRQVSTRRRWMQLGGTYALVLILLSALLGMLVDAEGLADAAQSAQSSRTAAEGQEAAPVDFTVVKSVLLWMTALFVPVSLVFWHTPALLHWGQMPVGKAVFFSAVASWRNLGAFAVYGVSWVVVMLGIGSAIQLVVALIPVPVVGGILATLGGLWLASALYASLYFTVVDCFESGVGTGTGTDTPPILPADDA